MKRLTKYIYDNWKWLAISIFVGYSIPVLVALYFPRSWAETISTFSPSTSFYLLIGAYILALFLVYSPARSFWSRYRRNFGLKEIPCTYLEPVLLCMATILTTALVFGRRLLGVISKSLVQWIIVVSALGVIWLFLVIWRKPIAAEDCLPSTESLDSNFFPDEPIVREEDDLLGRGRFIQDLYDQIVRYPSTDSFVFGLHGKWGEGKTSALNLLKTKLRENESFIVIDYDPWYFSSPDGMVKAFYEALHHSLNQRFFFPNLKETFVKYEKLLSWGLRVTGIRLPLEFGKESVGQLRDRIDRFIVAMGKKIIILGRRPRQAPR